MTIESGGRAPARQPRVLWADDDTDDTDEFDFSAVPLDPGQNPLPLPGLGLARE